MKISVKKMLIMTMIISALSTVNSWDYNKNETHPDGKNDIKDIQQLDGYYLVNGADLNNIGADLIGERIRICGYAREIKKFPVGTLLFLSEDKCFFCIIYWGSSIGNVPDDLVKRIQNNGIRTASGLINRYDGDKLTFYCSVDSLMKEGGMTGNALAYKACIVKIVYKWEKGWSK